MHYSVRSRLRGTNKDEQIRANETRFRFYGFDQPARALLQDGFACHENSLLPYPMLSQNNVAV